jgi:hypothetical protein
MTENKTMPTDQTVPAFLEKISDEQLRQDCSVLVELMRSVSKTEPVMWGSSIIGFGMYHYRYESGREGDNLIIGFSPRKQNIAIYLRGGLAPLQAELMELGKYKTGKGCLYIKSIKEIKIPVLKKMLSKAFSSI